MVKRSLDTFAVELSAHSEGFDGLVRRMGYMALLPLLEFPYGEVSERLVTALTNAGVPESQAQMVSLRELVEFALQRGSSYWAGLAVGWLGDGFGLDRELAEAVQRRVADKGAWPQQIRHQAFGLVRRWERNQAES